MGGKKDAYERAYIDFLKSELAFLLKRLKSCNKEGLQVLRLQIRQVEGDIRRNSKSEGV